MEYYNNSKSGVLAYHYGTDYIVIQFRSGGVYTYTYSSCGADSVETMKLLALQDVGLNTFINIYRPDYASKSASQSRNNFPYVT